jgi:hypothetical protein
MYQLQATLNKLHLNNSYLLIANFKFSNFIRNQILTLTLKRLIPLTAQLSFVRCSKMSRVILSIWIQTIALLFCVCWISCITKTSNCLPFNWNMKIVQRVALKVNFINWSGLRKFIISTAIHPVFNAESSFQILLL